MKLADTDIYTIHFAAPSEKLHALILAESVISIVGKEWLVGQLNLPDTGNSIPSDR